MNIIVSDSSTLILLTKTSLLKNVYLYFNKILIPGAVYKETIGVSENKEDAIMIEREIKDNRIKVEKVNDKKIFNEILKNFKCDLGEAESLTLAINKKSKLFTDDLEAIKICKVYDVEFVTALAFLIKLIQDNRIEKEQAIIKFEKLSKLGYYSKEILKYALEEINKNGTNNKF